MLVAKSALKRLSFKRVLEMHLITNDSHRRVGLKRDPFNFQLDLDIYFQKDKSFAFIHNAYNGTKSSPFSQHGDNFHVWKNIILAHGLSMDWFRWNIKAQLDLGSKTSTNHSLNKRTANYGLVQTEKESNCKENIQSPQTFVHVASNHGLTLHLKPTVITSVSVSCHGK